jgi:hypothetical protein
MRSRFLLTTFACLLLVLEVNPTFAFERRIGARPMGMGDAFVALADDMNAINYNPAGLALLSGTEGSLEYANLYPGLDDGLIQENHLVFAQPLKNIGTIGLAWNNRSAYGIYHENELIAGYGRKIPELPLWAGINLKLFYLDYTDEQSLALNSYFNQASEKIQVGVDLGVLYEMLSETELQPRLRTGLMIINLTEPDIGVSVQANEAIDIRLGMSAAYQEWDADLDLVYSDSEAQMHFGVEKWWLEKQWASRVGVIGGQGTGVTWTVGGSFAFDLDVSKVRINYAFNYSFGGIQETGGVHRISFDFIPFGKGTGQPSNVVTKKVEDQAQQVKVARIRSYLIKRIKRYFELIEMINAKKSIPGAVKAEEVAQAEDALHEAVGKLILEQDIIGFLRKIRKAETQVELLGQGTLQP